MSKVLYIGHYKERGGWANCAINQILAMYSVGIDVVCRNIPLTTTNGVVPEIIQELEGKDLRNVTHCIQHVLPHHMIGSTSVKNIAYYVAESKHRQSNVWHNYLDLMDEVWVPNRSLQENTSQILRKDVSIIHHAFEMSKYDKEFEQIDFSLPLNCFKFYSIIDLNSRKNIESIIRCYLNAFSTNDNVALILKVKKFGMQSNELKSHCINIIDDIQRRMRIYSELAKYPPIILITEEVGDDFIDQIHSCCDCYIGISRGEGWSMPAFEAMCFGNTPICSKEGGPEEFIKSDPKYGTLINGCYTICNQADGAFDHIFTGREFWFTPDEYETTKSMIYYYNNKEKYRQIKNKKLTKEYGLDFSYKSVGNKIGEKLDA